MKKIIFILVLFTATLSQAHDQKYCEEQFVTYCECRESWGSYSAELVIVNLNTNKEKRRSIGSINYSGDNAKKYCEQQMNKISVCRY